MMFVSIAIALGLVLITFTMHYQTLTWLEPTPKETVNPKERKPWAIFTVVFTLFWAHMIEIGIYAIAYYVSINHLGIGGLGGIASDTPMLIFYYSGVVYTSLGFGDIYPLGHIRFITQVEALNGLMLITWSASFTYLRMKTLWDIDQSQRS
jgi:hypothetical protein